MGIFVFTGKETIFQPFWNCIAPLARIEPWLERAYPAGETSRSAISSIPKFFVSIPYHLFYYSPIHLSIISFSLSTNSSSHLQHHCGGVGGWSTAMSTVAKPSLHADCTFIQYAFPGCSKEE